MERNLSFVFLPVAISRTSKNGREFPQQEMRVVLQKPPEITHRCDSSRSKSSLRADEYSLVNRLTWHLPVRVTYAINVHIRSHLIEGRTDLFGCSHAASAVPNCKRASPGWRSEKIEFNLGFGHRIDVLQVWQAAVRLRKLPGSSRTRAESLRYFRLNNWTQINGHIR